VFDLEKAVMALRKRDREWESDQSRGGTDVVAATVRCGGNPLWAHADFRGISAWRAGRLKCSIRT